jgi:hypothetical protein
MKTTRRPALELPTLLALVTLILSGVACGGIDPSQQGQDLTNDGVLSRMFGTITAFFNEKAAEDVPIAPAEEWSPPVGMDDPAVDELFEVMGLEEVQPTGEELELDGALVGLYEHFPDDDDPEDYYDSVCFFAKSPDQMPSQESLFWAEMFGVRASNGEVSDIEGKAIGTECVGCEEGNTDGGETRVIFYVNGIKTGWEDHCDTLEAISNKTGAVTIGIFNESEGALGDIWQTAWDRFTVQVENVLADWGKKKTIEIHQNKAANLLTNAIVQRVRAGKHVEIFAHSQGGAVTALALNRALRTLSDEGLYPVKKDGEDYPQAIKVATFGSAASQWPMGLWPDGPVYEHFVHIRDATPSALGVGAWGGFLTIGKKRAGGDALMVFFDGEPNEDYIVEEPEFEMIEPEDANVGILDLHTTNFHSMDMTYLEAYEQKHGAWNY